MARNRFTNPATGAFYDWPINHTEEEAAGKTRTITRTSNTGLVGLVKQQGDDGPMLMKLTGTILTRDQFRQMWAWYSLSRMQTIYFRDFDGQEAEVQVTSFLPKRERTLRNPRDPSIPHHYWSYTIEMEVYRFIAGDLADAGITP